MAQRPPAPTSSTPPDPSGPAAAGGSPGSRPAPRTAPGASGRRTTHRTTHRTAKLLAGFLAASVGAGVMAAGLVLPAVAVAGTATKGTVELFDSLPAELEEQPLSQQSRILYADGSLMATFYYENRVVVPLSEMSPLVQSAVVAVEDSRFFQHGGVDPQGMTRAFVQNLNSDDVQGASTLTQQWIKNVQVEQALSQLPPGASLEERQAAFADATQRSGIEGYTRKLREVKLAIAAEQRLSKEEILERYLNIANFAGGQYGVEAASRHWFNKSAKDLSLPDAALLAGIVQNPTGYDPVNNPQDSRARRDVVLGRMLATGAIDQAQHDEAVAVPLEAQLDVQETPNGCVQAGGAGFFCDYVVETLLEDPAFGEDRAERTRVLYRGGLEVTTTLDRAKQDAAVQEVNGFVPDDGAGVGASIVSVEPGTGKILAMAQNRAFDPRSESTTGGTSINYNVDYAMGGSHGFQPGSNAKPIVLAQWLAAGNTLMESVEAPRTKVWPPSSWTLGACAQGPYLDTWTVRNAGDSGVVGGRLPVVEATYRSINTAYAAMENRLQMCDVQAMASSLGVHQAQSGEPLAPYPSLVLGGYEVAPLTMASMYATFAAQGTHCTPTAVVRVSDPDGAELPVPAPQCRQAISPEVANGVTYALKETLVRGTARGHGLEGRVAAGKTGTTNQSVATWFTGYTPQLATSVWIGYPGESASLDGAVIAGQRRSPMYGGTIAAPMWKAYSDRALAGAPALPFTDPPPAMIGRSTAAPERQAASGSDPESGSETPSRPTRHSTGGGGDGGGGGRPAAAPAPAQEVPVQEAVAPEPEPAPVEEQAPAPEPAPEQPAEPPAEPPAEDAQG
ncbi:transglycosylase domain-containing protein [Quadrisphaera sp. DSM 44207]|uniref:transglycosylase domain-containing protein n=1 Tax=Quadrisphaera sp. DSM 44207 TaxID=1881057 RepID=UPI00088652CD|nr:transglycosylase domain-containing protein [Quadrisphaera sp. DSM 44207]SDQ18106.1 Membrane carboxypeptidase (penicillin-binding protein) [Quadrisphaera sp. DSM 44207]